jgi:hypothetical protein
MRKAKIMLSAVAVMAVVGGAFAFKAARQPHTFFYNTTNTAGQLRCIGVTETFLTTLTNTNPIVTNSYSPVSRPAVTCPLTTLYIAE